MNIRRRLSVLYAAIWAGLHLLLMGSLFSSFSHHLLKEVDESLVSWSFRTLEWEETGGLRGSADSQPEFVHPSRHLNVPDTFVVMLAGEGGVLLNQSAFSEQGIAALRQFVTGLTEADRDRFGRVVIEGQRFRVLGTTVEGKPGAPGHTIVVGRSLVHVDRTIRWLVASLIVAWLFAVMVCSTVMWVFVGHTLKPIHAMTVQALTITGSGDLSRRVEVHGGKDEFSALARALNRMLSSLQGSDESQRRFLADVSHELRTPLTSLRANLDFMRIASGAPAAEHQAALRDSFVETDRMTAMVNDLLLLARAETPPLPAGERSDLTAVAAEAAAVFHDRGSAPKRRFVADIPDRPACADCEARDIRQAIVILLDNAFKYTSEGGAVTLRLDLEEKRVRIDVEDDGPGVPPAEIGSVFERFYRATNVRDRVTGSGLGLPIVRSIVQRYGGSVELKNRHPQGLCATIRLPACT